MVSEPPSMRGKPGLALSTRPVRSRHLPGLAWALAAHPEAVFTCHSRALGDTPKSFSAAEYGTNPDGLPHQSKAAEKTVQGPERTVTDRMPVLSNHSGASGEGANEIPFQKRN